MSVGKQVRMRRLMGPSGRMLAIATYRATQFACQGKCVEPQSVGCKGK